MTISDYKPRLIAWEVTRRCKLKCRHCRAAAEDQVYQNEFTTDEIKKTLDNIAAFAKPIIILTGGEPMTRDDIYEIAAYGNSLGLRMVMAPCGHLVTPDAISKMKEAGIKRISLSIDGAKEESHDNFRCVKGSFRDAIGAANHAREGGMPFQINTTVTKLNLGELPDILELAKEIGAVSFHPFLLVPTGRGKELKGLELKPEEYEETLEWIYKSSKSSGMSVKPTCAPHYFRIVDQNDYVMAGGRLPAVALAKAGAGQKYNNNTSEKGHPCLDSSTRGCLGGTGFAFISHVGKVQICGFLDLECGNVRNDDYNFKNIWEESEIFNHLRNPKAYKGKCGICEYHHLCGGCRARAYALTGDYLKPEPYCVYIPQGRSRLRAAIYGLNRNILTALQDDFPIVSRPFKELASKFGLDESEILEKINEWKEQGIIRHLSAHVNTEKMGFESALVAMSVDSHNVETAAKNIAAHPGVSHNYLRDHKYNVWFTIKVPNGSDLKKHVDKIANISSVSDYLILPAVKTFKLNVKFDLSRLQCASNGDEKPKCCFLDSSQKLSAEEEGLLENLNHGLPLESRPFSEIAKDTGLSEDEVLKKILELKERGFIKKLRLVLNHYNLGIRANAMVVWDVDNERIDEAGAIFANKDYISHCYLRVRDDKFPYNIYTMIHADSEKTLSNLIESLAKEISPRSYHRLDTKKELLKRKTTLFRNKYLKWEEKYG